MPKSQVKVTRNKQNDALKVRAPRTSTSQGVELPSQVDWFVDDLDINAPVIKLIVLGRRRNPNEPIVKVDYTEHVQRSSKQERQKGCCYCGNQLIYIDDLKRTVCGESMKKMDNCPFRTRIYI